MQSKALQEQEITVVSLADCHELATISHDPNLEGVLTADEFKRYLIDHHHVDRDLISGGFIVNGDGDDEGQHVYGNMPLPWDMTQVTALRAVGEFCRMRERERAFLS